MKSVLRLGSPPKLNGASGMPERIAALGPTLAGLLLMASVVAPQPSNVAHGQSSSGETLLYQADWSTGLNGWVGPSDWHAANGIASSDGSGGYTDLRAPFTPPSDDYAVEAEMQLDGYDLGIWVRYSGADSPIMSPSGSGPAYMGAVTPPSIARLQWGQTALAQKTFSPGSAWHTYRVEVSGDDIRFLIDGNLMAEAHDSQFPTGRGIGLYQGASSKNQVRNFRVYSTSSQPRPYQAAVLGDNPISYWRLDEASGAVAHDSKGHNDGTISGGVTLGAPGATGDGNTSMSFDGSAGGIAISGAVSLQPPIVSVEAWVKPIGARAGFNENYAVIRSGNGYSLEVGSGTGAGQPIFQSNACGTNCGVAVLGSGVVNDGAWHHLVGTTDSSDVRLYVDGALVGSAKNPTAAIAYGFADTGIGIPPFPGFGLFRGSIADVAVYDHALTPAQVAAHYKAATSGGGGVVTTLIIPTPKPVPDDVDFDYAMVDRLPIDDKGIMIYPRDINPSSLKVDLNACPGGLFTPRRNNAISFEWVWPTGTSGTVVDCVFRTSLPKGMQKVTLVASFPPPPGTVDSVTVSTRTITKTVDVRDVLVVSVGDSVASGEANPDVNGTCDEASIFDGQKVGDQDSTACATKPIWQKQFPDSSDPSVNANQMCHRSTWAYGPQAAKALAASHPQVAMTFLHVACSGATVNHLLTNKQDALDHFSGDHSQVDRQFAQINQARQGRQIDALIISIGANDIGFADALKECITDGARRLFLDIRIPDCKDSDIHNALLANFNTKLEELGGEGGSLDRLHDCIGEVRNADRCKSDLFLNVRPDHVFLLGYPSIARGTDGSFCGNETSVLRPAVWEFAESQILTPLNQVLGAKAAQFGWSSDPLGDFNVPPENNLGGSFLIHGVCATDTWIRPFNNDGGNTSGDQQNGSYDIQGDRQGAFHPNREGHERMKRALETAIADKIY